MKVHYAYGAKKPLAFTPAPFVQKHQKAHELSRFSLPHPVHYHHRITAFSCRSRVANACPSFPSSPVRLRASHIPFFRYSISGSLAFRIRITLRRLFSLAAARPHFQLLTAQPIVKKPTARGGLKMWSYRDESCKDCKQVMDFATTFRIFFSVQYSLKVLVFGFGSFLFGPFFVFGIYRLSLHRMESIEGSLRVCKYIRFPYFVHL